jgi:hypothetical protein
MFYYAGSVCHDMAPYHLATPERQQFWLQYLEETTCCVATALEFSPCFLTYALQQVKDCQLTSSGYQHVARTECTPN